MINTIKKIIDKEFAANEIDIAAKVNEYAWQGGKVSSYQVTLHYSGSRKVLTILMNSERPFKPKIMPANYIEPHKMFRLCEIIQEAFNELERARTDV